MIQKKIFPILLLSIIGCTLTKNKSNYASELSTFRQEYKDGFLHDDRSPLTKDDLPFLDFYPAEPAWKLTCQCTKVENAKTFDMPTYSGVTRLYRVYAMADCKYKGKDIRLNIYQNMTQPANPLYKGYLFLPFKDYTNDEETYGGGRYINLYEKDITDNQITIDFNKCYNPWCAYSSGYNCPVPPKENHLAFEVNAGEKKFKGTYKKQKSDK